MRKVAMAAAAFSYHCPSIALSPCVSPCPSPSLSKRFLPLTRIFPAFPRIAPFSMSLQKAHHKCSAFRTENADLAHVLDSNCTITDSSRIKLEDINWDHSFVRELPGDSREGGPVRQVLHACYTKVAPSVEVDNPELVAWSESCGGLLDLDIKEYISKLTDVEILCGFLYACSLLDETLWLCNNNSCAFNSDIKLAHNRFRLLEADHCKLQMINCPSPQFGQQPSD